MKPIAKTFVLLSAIIGLSLGSPLDFESIDNEITPFVVGDGVYRLSDDVTPISYLLELTPYLANETGKDAFTFDGVVTITLRATKANVLAITLHQRELMIERYDLTGALFASGVYDSTQYDPVTEKWTIVLATALPQDSDTDLKVTYKGTLNDEMKGFYRSYYFEGTEKVWMASTQFQSTDARRAFPCFDEPGFKAAFKVIMNTPAGYSTISNTGKVGSVANPTTGRLVETFDTTPPMSTYLLAFIVSKYEGNINNTFGVYSRPATKVHTDLALRFGQEMLSELGKYLGIDYYSVDKITKMDMAAIPDFSAGAMENWGLLTYRETNILYYPQDTPSLNEQRIVAVIAHEQAHMWFGDLVTCKWWSETWLNEGFARYFQYFGTQMLRPDWDLEEQFVVENLQQSMQLDSTAATHAMTNPTVNTPVQASDMFDNISYNKAASIIRMLSHYIRLDKFQETLKNYLAENRGKAVVPQQLFTAIETVNPSADVTSSFFGAWTQTEGFPLVTAKVDNLTLTVTQKRFMRSEAGNNKTVRYNIPITFTIDSEGYEDTVPKFVFRIDEGDSKSYNFTKQPAKYFILNNQQTGYYRVNYDAANWLAIREALHKDDHDKIHVMNRAQVVDDLFNLARAGIVKYDVAVDTIRYIKKEKHYIPWLSAISHGLTFLSQRVSGAQNQEVFSWFIRDTMSEIYNHLKFEPSSTDRRTDIYNRPNIISWACKYGHEDCIKLSKDAFQKFVTGIAVSKDERAAVYCNAVRYGNGSEFDYLYNKYMTEDISAEQLNLLAGMGCTKDVALVKKYLDRLISTDDIRPQDRAAAINNILNSNPEGPQFLYDYIVQNHAAWRTKIGSLTTLSTIAGRFTTKAQFDTYAVFLAAQQTDLGTAHASLLDSLTSSRKNLEWDDEYMKAFMDHLTYLKGSAPVKAISILLSVVSVVVLYIFN